MTDDLDDLFATAAARNATLALPDALMARVLVDAAREQLSALPVVPDVAAPPARCGFWAGGAAFFGGGGVVAGLGSVAVLAAVLGFVQPPAMLAVTDAFTGSASVDSLDLMPGVDALLSEE